MRGPIVLVHGILGFNQLMVIGKTLASYFREIPDALRAKGFEVPKPPQLNPVGSVATRAADLRRYLENEPTVAGKQVHIIAHSMGGLDARYMISKLGGQDRVLSLTTIGTPHRGSPLADLVMAGTNQVARAMFTQLGVGGVEDLTTATCAARNADCADSEKVRYFSVAGRFDPAGLGVLPLSILGPAHDVIQTREGDNDGMVSVQSAKYGSDAARWTYLGTWEANHFRLVNWGTNLAVTPAERADRTIVDGYLQIVGRVME